MSTSPIVSKSGGRFYPIDLRALRLEARTDFDVYLDVRGDMVLYRSRDLVFDINTLTSLRSNGVTAVFVRSDEGHALAGYFERHLRFIVSDDSMPVAVLAALVIQAAEGVARGLLQDPNPATVRRAAQIARDLARFAGTRPDAVSGLLKLLGTGSLLESHSVNTAVFAMTMAHCLPSPSRETLALLAASGLFHDVGLSLIASDTVRKAGALDASERAVIREHPIKGEQILRQSGCMTDEVLLAVRWHHERLDGTGYPDGLSRQSIPLVAQVVSVAEVFDSLTSDQPYRRRLSPYRALRLMRSEMQGHLDGSLINRFIPKLIDSEGVIQSGPSATARASRLDHSGAPSLPT